LRSLQRRSTDGNSRAKTAAATVINQQDCDRQYYDQKYDVRKIKLHQASLNYGFY
jgi:hypothetical protein